MNFTIRLAQLNDFEQLKSLYLAVAAIPGGIARETDEITDEYINKNLQAAVSRGVMLVAEVNESQILVAAIHAYRLEPKVFAHILSELTVVVHPDWQKCGLGKRIFQEFLTEISNNYPDILRVELIARESNTRAIALYESLGFIQEGRLANRIHSVGGGNYEADIPMAWLNPQFRN